MVSIGNPSGFGCVVRVPSPQAVPGIARAAEAAGLDFLGLGDSQSLGGDTYVHQTNAGAATSTLRVGSCVTNVVTRHIAVTVSAAQTVNELTDGRAFIGVSVGDSAVLNLGMKPASIHTLETSIKLMRRLATGERIDHESGFMHVSWCHRPLPILVAAEGPRSSAMAGRVADGVFVGVGLSPEARATAQSWLDAGLADRDPGLDDLEVWHMARLGLDEDGDEALRQLRPALASIGHHGLSSGLENKGVPADLVPVLEELGRRYDTRHHNEPGDSPNARLVDELGLTGYLAERYAVVGTPEDCARRVTALRKQGVDRLLFTITASDPARILNLWKERVAPLIGR